MTPKEFLEQFILIEDHLFSLASAFDRKQGFTNLLKHLRQNKIVSDNIVSDLYTLWQTRNKFVSSSSFEDVNVTTDVIEKLRTIRQQLNLA